MDELQLVRVGICKVMGQLFQLSLRNEAAAPEVLAAREKLNELYELVVAMEMAREEATAS